MSKRRRLHTAADLRLAEDVAIPTGLSGPQSRSENVTERKLHATDSHRADLENVTERKLHAT